MAHSKNTSSPLVKRMPKHLYEEELERLHIQLVSMQQWVIETGARVVVIFEGRDAAGKGGAIKRIMQYLTPERPEWQRCQLRTSAKKANGTFNATFRTSLPPARSC